MAKFKNKDLLLKTNQQLHFGDSNDRSVYFDGTHLTFSGTSRFVSNLYGADVFLTGDATISGLSASRLTATDANDKLVSTDLNSWVAGTSGEIDVADDGDGSITLSIADPLNIANLNLSTNATITGTLGVSGTSTFGGSVNLPSLTASRLVYTDGSGNLASVTDLTSWVAGTANRVTVSDDGDGTITLSAPQDLHTGATPTFAGMTLTDDLTITGTGADIFFGDNIISGTGDIYCGNIYADLEDTSRKSGRVDCINGSNTVTGTFSSAFSDALYSLVVSLEKDAGTPSQYAMTITNQTSTGFVVELSGDIDDSDYDLHYVAIHD